ncbi:MAG: bifunctional metallophosphatase/5'-nucleotidase [bacterium]|nr:bifunctional metallophosphatase/5'-nucleotidase [bacterium]
MNRSAILTQVLEILRKNIFYLLVTAFSLIFGFVIVAPELARASGSDNPPPAESNGSFNLTLFHTNDSHSFFLPRPAVWRDDGRLVGGAISLAWHLDREKINTEGSIFLDAGDFMTGNPVCQIADEGVPGEAVAGIMSLLGYDAGVLGNHEFDIGVQNVKDLVPLFEYPVLAADIVDEKGQPVFRSEPVVLSRNSLKIGIIGVSCMEMDEVVAPSRFQGLENINQSKIIRKQAANLDSETDLLVVISHNGVDNDLKLAKELHGSGVDVIVGGHSHSRLKKPRLVGNILVVQAGSKWTNLGRLDLKVENDRVTGYKGRLITLWADGATAGPELTALVGGYEKQVAERFGRTLGTLKTDWHKGRSESNLGNYLADQMRLTGNADVGLINSGGIRKSMKAGPITALDINEMLPFSNSLVTMELTGKQLATVIQSNADAQVGGQHGILQVSGVAYQFRTNGEEALVEEILVAGKLLKPETVYTVAMPDYVVMMADVYLNIEVPERVNDVGLTITEAVVQAVAQASGPIESKIEGRIMRLDP